MVMSASNRIKEVRLSKRLSQAALAEAMGIHWVTLSKIERGKQKLTQEWLERISSALEVSQAELLLDAPLRRSVRIAGALIDQGYVKTFTERSVFPDGIGLQFEFGTAEGTESEWIMISTNGLFPTFHLGDVVRFSEISAQDADVYLGRLCLIDSKQVTKHRKDVSRALGFLRKSKVKDRFDLDVPGTVPFTDLSVERIAVASLALFSPTYLGMDYGTAHQMVKRIVGS